ncbi:MAG: four helix bundle protein [Bacteroidales bacterium]|nr:four helix bundle protein [Bacteroidales bacterium]
MSYSFENIIAWQKAHQFTLNVYKHTQQFPKEELFALTSQFRRAAVSIEANIAEGSKRLSRKAKLSFFNTSQGSLEECRNYIILSKDLGYIDETGFLTLNNEIEIASRFLNAYCKAVVNNDGIDDGIINDK